MPPRVFLRPGVLKEDQKHLPLLLNSRFVRIRFQKVQFYSFHSPKHHLSHRERKEYGILQGNYHSIMPNDN